MKKTYFAHVSFVGDFAFSRKNVSGLHWVHSVFPYALGGSQLNMRGHGLQPSPSDENVLAGQKSHFFELRGYSPGRQRTCDDKHKVLLADTSPLAQVSHEYSNKCAALE